MARSKDDPMSGLLSSIGGIDSSLFQKPQAMRDMRGNQSSPSKKLPDLSSSHKPHQPIAQAQPQPIQAKKGSVLQANSAQPQGPVAKTKAPADSNSQLDALFGKGVFTKTSRPMRDASKTAAPRPADYTDLRHNFQEQASILPVQPSGSRTFQSGVTEDLDSVFGPASSSASWETSMQNTDINDPFSLFGGLGVTEKATSQPPIKEEENVGANLQSRKASSPANIRGQRPANGGSGEWGTMMGALPGTVSPTTSNNSLQGPLDIDSLSPSSASPKDDPPDTRVEIDSTNISRRHSRSKVTPPSVVDSPPPSYESVVRISSPRGLSSPRSRHQRYQIYRDADNEEPGSSPNFLGSGGPPSPDRMQPKGSRQQQQHEAQLQGPVKDQAKQWLSAGQKWLSGASKKVAQAVKETQATINSKLEELEGRQAVTNGGRNRMMNQQPGAKTRSQAQQGGDGALEDIPQYYFDWAKTIEALPAHEQGPTLSAMPEEDAQTIQHILRHKARRRSLEETETAMVAAARRRSLSNEELPERAGGAVSPSIATARRTRSSEFKGAPARHQQPDPKTAGRPHSAVEERQPTGHRATPSDHADLIGLTSQAGDQHTPQMQDHGARAPTALEKEDDLMGLHTFTPPQAPAASLGNADILGLSSTERRAQATPQGVSLDDVFSSPGHVHTSNVSPDLQELFGAAPPASHAQGSRGGSNLDSMIDFGEEGPSVAGHENLYQPGFHDEEQEGEPEARKVARQRRLAQTHARMQKQLAEKLARDKAEAAQQEAQHDLRTHHRERIEAWKSGKKDNIRALLSTLHTILWENSGWTAPGMTDLVEPARVKRSYMKANLIVHPDKVKQKGGTVEQIVVADMAFDTLKTAWSKFEATELRSR